MVHPEFYSPSSEDYQGVLPEWFDAQHSRYSSNSDILKAYLAKEIDALKAFHDGETNTEQASHTITRPISTTPIPAVGTSSDDIVVLTQLWRLYKDALIEWPHVSLDDDDEKPFTWESLPYIVMVWTGYHWMDPIGIVERCADAIARRHARDVYIKQQDVEAQIVAAGIFKWKHAIKHVINALESEPRTKSYPQPRRNGEEELVVDFHIPAAGRWIKDLGQRMYTSLKNDEVKT
ncbi:hypothetical protein QQX98_002540 [Neonectria punicea]|uniref:Uncharacterized protein n=1 Tax=Neonectria punicea TaxID=979145 RepID=A0ABR1HJ39_9HYPO